MLILYYRPSCPFCQRVLNAGEDLSLTFVLKDISDPTHLLELKEQGGKQQVPYLVDTDADVRMYESTDIIAYLESKTGITKKVRIHQSSDVCDPVE